MATGIISVVNADMEDPIFSERQAEDATAVSLSFFSTMMSSPSAILPLRL
jgi:hypothetical protein